MVSDASVLFPKSLFGCRHSFGRRFRAAVDRADIPRSIQCFFFVFRIFRKCFKRLCHVRRIIDRVCQMPQILDIDYFGICQFIKHLLVYSNRSFSSYSRFISSKYCSTRRMLSADIFLSEFAMWAIWFTLEPILLSSA